jgi:hypothetical protein
MLPLLLCALSTSIMQWTLSCVSVAHCRKQNCAMCISFGLPCARIFPCILWHTRKILSLPCSVPARHTTFARPRGMPGWSWSIRRSIRARWRRISSSIESFLQDLGECKIKQVQANWGRMAVAAQWRPPLEGECKVNVNGAVVKTHNQGGSRCSVSISWW